MPEHRRNSEVIEMPTPHAGDDRYVARYSDYDRRYDQFEPTNDNANIPDLRLFRPTRKQMVLSSGFGIGALLALFAMLNGSTLYQAESRIFVDVKQVQIQSGLSGSPAMDPETVSRIVNDKLLEITSQPILSKVSENLGLQKTRLFNSEDDSDILTSISAWYRSFFQREPLAAIGSEYADPAEQLERAISVTPDEDSSVISIRVTTGKARTSAMIANQIAEVLKQTENQPAPASTVSQSDLDAMLAKVQKADMDVASFQVQTPVVGANNDNTELKSELSDLREKIQTVQKNIDLLKKSGTNISTLNVIPDELLTAKLYGLKGQLRDAQGRVVELQQNLGPKHPDLLAAQKAVDSISSDIKKELPILAKSLELDLTNKKAAETLLSQELDNQKTDLSTDQASYGPSLDNLQKQADLLHSQYAAMLLNGPNKKAPDPVIRLVSKATVPTTPVRAGFATTLFAVFVGGFIGLLVSALSLISWSELLSPPQFQQPRHVEYGGQQDDERPAEDDNIDAYLAELSLAEASLEEREKELELREIQLLNSRLERLAGLLDRANEGLAVQAPVEMEARQYPAPAEDLYERVYSQAANISRPGSAYSGLDLDASRDLERVRNDLRALRGKVVRYAGRRA